MAISLDALLSTLSTGLTILSVLLGNKYLASGRTGKILQAIAAAEHMIDAVTHNGDGTLNEARVTFALQVLSHIAPRMDQVKAKAEIEGFLAVIHAQAHATQAQETAPTP
jgi:hypothetical protein